MLKTRKHPLVAFREANGGISQSEAAALVGITQSHWSRLENGLAFVKPRVAKRISELTGVSMSSLMNFGDNDTGRNAVESPTMASE